MFMECFDKCKFILAQNIWNALANINLLCTLAQNKSILCRFSKIKTNVINSNIFVYWTPVFFGDPMDLTHTQNGAEKQRKFIKFANKQNVFNQEYIKL